MKILFISLGCDKTLVDSEVMLGMLTSKGYEITDDENEAHAALLVMLKKKAFAIFLRWLNCVKQEILRL